jgi:hypothetical protein
MFATFMVWGRGWVGVGIGTEDKLLPEHLSEEEARGDRRRTTDEDARSEGA